MTLNDYRVKKAPLRNTNARRRRLNATVFNAVSIAVVLGGLSTPASALTADDVVNKMNAQEHTSWVTGAVDMAAHLYRRMGDEQRATCLLQWNSQPGVMREIDETMRANPTLPAATVMDVLIARHCAPKP